MVAGNLGAELGVIIRVGGAEQRAVCEREAVADSWFEAVYARDRLRLFRLARLLTGSDSIAEDVVQEAFLRLHKTGQIPANPAAYLRTTVVNLCRKRARRLEVERRITHPAAGVVLPPEIDETWVALSRLPVRQRTVLVLRYYEDLSEAEIAENLGWPRGTVKSCLHRGLARMRKELPGV